MWFSEVKDMPATTVSGYTEAGATGEIGHYTQLVWAKTTKVGCGFMKNYDDQWYKQVIILRISIASVIS